MNRKGKRRKGNKGRWNSSTVGSWGSDVLTCRIPSPVLSKGERMKSEASVSLRKAFVLCKARKLLAVPSCYFRRRSWTLLKQLRDS